MKVERSFSFHKCPYTMGPSSRKSKASPSSRPSKGHASESQTKTETIKPVKLKPKSKSKKTTNKWLWICILVVIFGIAFLLLGDKFGISSVLRGRSNYEFRPIPVPKFDINRGIERRSNLSLEEYTKLYDAKWY